MIESIMRNLKDILQDINPRFNNKFSNNNISMEIGFAYLCNIQLRNFKVCSAMCRSELVVKNSIDREKEMGIKCGNRIRITVPFDTYLRRNIQTNGSKVLTNAT